MTVNAALGKASGHLDLTVFENLLIVVDIPFRFYRYLTIYFLCVLLGVTEVKRGFIFML